MKAGRLYMNTFGCQMNRADSELVQGALQREGYLLTDNEQEADVILYNTCSVRAHAEAKAYSYLGRLRFLKQRRPQVVIGVMGCMAQREREEIFRRVPYVDLVCGPMSLDRIPSMIHAAREDRERQLLVEEDRAPVFDRQVQSRPEGHRAWITVMRGCDMACSYCIVPFVRGPEVSVPLEDVVAECRRLADDGVVEVTFLGQTVDHYGKNLRPRRSLAELIRKVAEIDGMRRIRFVTSHPSFIDVELMQAVAEVPQACEYLHMPAQSGSDGVLKRMRRGYDRRRYLDIVERARQVIPGVEIASDFIVGFPGETEEDFLASLSLVKDLRFSNSFIFKYSPRPSTEAFPWADDVPEEVKKDRNNRLLAAQQQVMAENMAAMIGRRVEVLVDGVSKNDPGRQTGRTRGNRIVCFQDDRDRTGEFVEVEVTAATPLTLFGEPARSRVAV